MGSYSCPPKVEDLKNKIHILAKWRCDCSQTWLIQEHRVLQVLDSVQEQLFSCADIGGDILIFKLETMRVFGYLWSEGVVWLREKQRQNRTMTLQHPPPPAEAAAKAIWPSPESLCILISSKTRVITRLPWMRGMRLVQRPCCCSVLLRDNTGLWGLCFLTDDALLLCLAPARCRTSVA